MLTPFMGVSSEVLARCRWVAKTIGIELKESYFKQAKNQFAIRGKSSSQIAAATTNASKSLETEAA